jgi:regulator of sigma E protease
MHDVLMQAATSLLAVSVQGVLGAIWPWVLIALGFSAVIFVHEFGHYVLAKLADVRVDKFCIGFGRELFGFTRGETRYGFNILPLGGYVKMLGQEDFDVDSNGELTTKTDDPRSFANKPVGTRMAIVSGGVLMNVAFAAFLFMIVFMIGLDSVVTEVGYVLPNSPAARGGLQVGDDVVRVNGKKINEFGEMNMAIMLADPHRPMDFEVRRQGKNKHLTIQPENSEERGVLMVGMGPAMTNQVVASPPGADPEREDLPRPGDRLVEVDGQEITDENANEIYLSLVNDPAEIRTVIVERPEDPEVEDSPTKRVQVEILPTLHLSPSDPLSTDLINVLGLSPLMRVSFVAPEERAEKAGLEVGDIVMKIGDTEYPTQARIYKTIKESCRGVTGPEEDDFDYEEADIPIVVQRRDEPEPIALTLRPKVRSRLFGRNSFPNSGASFDLVVNDLLRVGEIVPEIDGTPTPAARAGIPAGSLIKEVNDLEASTWIDLVEQLRTCAGQTVTISYEDAEGRPGSGDFTIPQCLRTKLGLPVASQILAIDDDEKVKVTLKDKERSVSISHWYGLKTKLAQNVGQTVTVRYKRGYFDTEQTARIKITEDMIDPWLGRVTYGPNLRTAQATKLLRTTNPIEAVGIGIRKTTYFVLNVYNTMKRMIFTRTVGVEHLSGPVGIVKIGSDMASVSFNQLLYFLAIISANLAVINFLPLPIVDGGLMVFLIIEKIKGTPVSVKTQVVTQVLGLVLIIAAFLYVTLQDLQRLFG